MGELSDVWREHLQGSGVRDVGVRGAEGTDKIPLHPDAATTLFLGELSAIHQQILRLSVALDDLLERGGVPGPDA